MLGCWGIMNLAEDTHKMLVEHAQRGGELHTQRTSPSE